MGIVVLGAVFVDIKGYPSDVYIPGGRNAGRVEQMHGGVSRNIVEDIANVELQPTFIGLVDDTGAGADVVRKLKAHKVNTDYIRVTKDGMGTWLAIFVNGGDVVDAYTWYSAIAGGNSIPQFYTYSATNVRLQEASIGYTIPRKLLRNVCEITVSIVGRNLWMLYNKAPFDPESIATTGNYYQGIDYFMMPSLRNVGFNLRLKF